MTRIIRIIFLFSTIFATRADFPSYVTPCKLSDPKINDCFITLLGALRGHFKDGIPELKVPVLDPLHLEKLSLKMNSLDIKATDVNIYGISNIKIEKFNIDLDKKRVDMELSLPSAQIYTQYGLKGKLLMFDLNGQGEANFNLTGVTIQAKIKFDFKKQGEDTIANIQENEAKLQVKGVKLYLSDIFKDNKELTENTNQVLNENVDVILPDLLPLLDNTISKLVLDLLQSIFSTVPIRA